MTTYQDHYNKLNKEQRSAVDHIAGPLLVLAGPGTGKTQLLSVRAANMILNKGVAPESILILTFTNAAARAMRDRLAKIVGHAGYDVEVETFHSFANSIVLEAEGAIDFIKDKIEISEVEKVRTIEYILKNDERVKALRPFGSPYIHRREIEKRISDLKNEGISPDKLRELVSGFKDGGSDDDKKRKDRLKALSVIYESYEKLKNDDAAKLFDERGRIDFDDMILIAIEAIGKDEGLRQGFRERYKYIMVDEYQDTNVAQRDLLFSILDPKTANICCVGDDDQAIYRFQGATLSNFRVLRETLPGLTEITLKDNYRSTQDILDLAASVIGQMPDTERIGRKDLKARRTYASKEIQYLEFQTEEEELAYLVDEIKRQAKLIAGDAGLDKEERDKPYNNIAILVRKRAQIQMIVNALLKEGIPYATDGKEDIRGEKRVKQLLDVLELVSISPERDGSRSLALYKILTADYIGADHSDILKMIKSVNDKRREARDKSGSRNVPYDLFQEFEEDFLFFNEEKGDSLKPLLEDSKKLEVSSRLGLRMPHPIHKAAWAIKRLLTDAMTRPVHDILMSYIEDVGLYQFILERYDNDKVIRLRDLRALVQFINMIKQADLSNPAVGLKDFMEEMDLREMHGMPIQGELATMSQDGVRLFTAHSSKGLEFYTVFMPFSLQQKSWPLRGKPDVVPLPREICRSKEKADEDSRRKELNLFDELRLFYVATTRAKANLIYTATPKDKVIVSQFLSRVGMTPEKGSPMDEEAFLAAYLKKGEKKDLFEGTNAILKDIVSGLTLNPTSVNNFIKCKRKFLYDNVLMLPEKKSQQLTFGNCAHKALEEVYTEYVETGKFPAFKSFMASFMGELKFQGVTEEIKRWCVDKLEDLEEWYNSESRLPIMPLDLENKLDVVLPGGIVFRGTFDKVEEESAGRIRVVDYKTGKPDDHVKAIKNCKDLSSYECDDYYRQLVAYKMLYDRSSKVRVKGEVVKGVLQFLEPVSSDVIKYDLRKGEYIKVPVELTAEMVKELERVITKCWEDIQSLKFDKLPRRDDEDRCSRCDFDGICWG